MEAANVQREGSAANHLKADTAAPRFQVRAIRPQGWSPFLKQYLDDLTEVERMALGSVRTGPEGGFLVLAVVLSVYTPAERLRALRLKLERLLPTRVPLAVLFTRAGRPESGLAAALVRDGATLFRRGGTPTHQARPA